MKPTPRNHPENNSPLSQKVIDEVCAMFAGEANNLLDTLADLQPDIRDVVLHAVRDYHKALDSNNAIVIQVATIMANADTVDVVNDTFY